jgi:hypothetical protein
MNCFGGIIWESDLPVRSTTPPKPWHQERQSLSGECLDNRLSDRVGIFVKYEVTAVEISQVGCRHYMLHDFRFGVLMNACSIAFGCGPAKSSQVQCCAFAKKFATGTVSK